MEEIWKDIIGFENKYQISNLGRIKSLKRNILRIDGKYKCVNESIRKIGLSCGYPDIKLCTPGKKVGKYIHRLLAEHFIPNPENKLEVNHKDTNKLNFELSNLEWSTKKYNLEHARKLGLGGSIRNHISSSIPIIQLSLKNELIKEWPSQAEASRNLNVTSHSISRCLKGSTKTCKGFKWQYK